MREKWDKRVFLISYYYKNSCIHTTIFILLNAIAYFYFFISHIYTYCGKVQLFGKCMYTISTTISMYYTLHFQQLWKLNPIMYYLSTCILFLCYTKKCFFWITKGSSIPYSNFFWQKSIFKSLKWSGSTTSLTGL